jgi:hypothetical protein
MILNTSKIGMTVFGHSYFYYNRYYSVIVDATASVSEFSTFS